jgi:hypothetical protein
MDVADDDGEIDLLEQQEHGLALLIAKRDRERSAHRHLIPLELRQRHGCIAIAAAPQRQDQQDRAAHASVRTAPPRGRRLPIATRPKRLRLFTQSPSPQPTLHQHSLGATG